MKKVKRALNIYRVMAYNITWRQWQKQIISPALGWSTSDDM